MYASVVFIGDHPLVVACAGRAREAGLDVAAITTSDPSIAKWAAGEGVEEVAWADLGDHLRATRPDVLLSVGNLRIIPEDMLDAVGVAINFHDGPLPGLAGLHTPMWALLADETSYEVTWHVVERGVDEGDVLATDGFEIAPTETTRSMNIKCFGAAGAAFDDVVRQLTAGELDRTPQAGEGQYFGRYDRPIPAGALIPHTMTAEEIGRYVRALDFGPTINRVGRALLQLDDHSLMVVHTATSSVDHPDTTAGSVAAVVTEGLKGDEVSITVGTATTPVVLSGWSNDHSKLAELVGAQLPDPTPALADIEKAHSASARNEVHWSRRIAGRTPVDLTHLGSPLDRNTATAAGVPGDMGAAAAVAAAFVLAYSGQTAATVDVDVAGAGLDTLGPWFVTALPVDVSIDFEATVAEALTAVTAQLRAANERGPFLRDVPIRMPVQVDGPIPPSSAEVAIVADGVTTAARVCISISADGSTFTVDAPGASSSRIAAGLEAFAATAVHHPTTVLRDMPVLGDAEITELFSKGGEPSTDAFRGPLHEQFLAAAAASPEAVAVVHRGHEITYAELEVRARRVASALADRRIGPGGFVGVSTAPSLEMVVAVLGVLLSGCAYVPLDPRFPAERLEFMVGDADMNLVLTDGSVQVGALPTLDIASISTDEAIAPLEQLPAVGEDALAYMMYTSGSTGLPKGVMVQHGNVDSFLQAMEPHVGLDPDGVWLSVTTLSFDISVLELFYPLLHGWKVVLYEGLAASRPAASTARTETRLDMSLFFFGSEGVEGGNSYQVLLDAARYADTHGFGAVWTPERHFHAFGGPFPNPAVTAAALAAITENIDVRAGSCVLPLHHPVRVAEEWAVVDQLSGGRVGISIAAGWHPDDFVLRPQNHGQPKTALIEQIEQLRSLWRGERVTFEGPKGPVDVLTLPRPVQPEVPLWYTTAGNIESFELAGRQGLNLLTHLLGQSTADLTDKIAAYRRAWTDAGHEGRGTVSLMLHTFVSTDGSMVEETVREPMKGYLRDSIGLLKDHASSFPTFDPTKTDADGALAGLTPEDMEALLDVAFARYFQSSGLFGSVADAVDFAERVAECDVDEIAALIDFGIDGSTVLANLDALNEVRSAFLIDSSPAEPETYGSLMAQHGVTHLQCTPSEARIVLAEPASKAALGSLRKMLVGGEACPASVAGDLHDAVGGDLINVYGPTETTIWSTIHTITGADIEAGSIPVGVPLANTVVRVAAENGQLRPAGAIGELLIGGAGVTRGYHAREELTADRFVARIDTEGNVYRTGDLVSWRTDGTLAFHGRADSQVKVRGHRIELGEIEAALEKRTDVQEAVVVVHGEGDRAGLVAHLVGDSGHDEAGAIRQELSVSLPSHMVPERFMWHDLLPTTPNGKVDRKTLSGLDASTTPAAPTGNANTDGPAVATAMSPLPSSGSGMNATEMAVLIEGAWQHVLGVDKIDRFKSFFDHGGNSLQVVTLRDTLEDRLGRTVSLVDLFRFGTVNELAEAFADKADASQAQDAGNTDPAAELGEGELVAVGSEDAQGRVSRRAAARRKARRGK